MLLLQFSDLDIKVEHFRPAIQILHQITCIYSRSIGLRETQYGDVSTVFTVASSSLKHTANEIGADAVVGCEFDVGFDSEGPYVTGFGTAVKLK